VEPYSAALVVRFRNPNAIRAASLIIRLVASVSALVIRVSQKARIWGHQASTVWASRVASGMSAARTVSWKVVQPVGDGVPVAGREQHPKAFLHSPGGADLTCRVAGRGEGAGEAVQGAGGEPVTGAQQQPAIRPRRVGLAAPAGELVPKHPLPHVGDHLGGEPVEVEVVGDHQGVGQRLRHRRPVGRAHVDRDHLHLGLPVHATSIEPAQDRLGGPAGALAEQAARAGQVDEVGLEPLQADPAAVLLLVQRGRSPRVSSIPSTRGAAGSMNTFSAWTTNAQCATGQLIARSRHTEATERPEPTASAAARRVRPVILARGGSSAIDSVNALRLHNLSRHANWILCHRTCSGASP